MAIYDNYEPAQQEYPTYIANMPAASEMSTSGSWVVSAGYGKFVVLARYYPGGSFCEIRSVTCDIDSDLNISEGVLEYHREDPYGSGFSYSFSSRYGSAKVLTMTKTNNNSFCCFSFSGLDATQTWYNILGNSFYNFVFSPSARVTYLQDSDKFLLGIDDSGFDPRIFSLSIDGDSVTEHGYSDIVLPAGVYFSFPEANFSTHCGGNKAVFLIRNDDGQMTFFHIDGDLNMSDHFQCQDANGIPLSITGDTTEERFVAVYINETSIKCVYGEIDGSSFLFSEPVVLATCDDTYSYCGSAWINGTNAFNVCFSYKQSSRKFTILSCKVSNFVVDPYYDDHKTYSMDVGVIPCCFYDEFRDKVVIGLYGDGSSYMPNSYGSYVIIADAAIGEAVLFWQDRMLHKEGENGSLIKEATVTVIPGTPGQKYIPSSPGVPSKTSHSTYYQKVCKRVG